MVFVFFLLISRLSLFSYSNFVMTLAVNSALSTSTAMSSACMPIKCYSHIFLSSFDFFSTLSTTKLTNFGLSGEPCITPFSTSILTPKISISWPSSRLMISSTQWLVISPSFLPTCLSNSHNFFLLIPSKALAKSTKRKLIPSFTLARTWVINSCVPLNFWTCFNSIRLELWLNWTAQA